MPPIYSLTCITNRLQGVINTIDGGGSNASLQVLAGGTVVSTIQLKLPSANASGGVLTFFGTPLTDPSAAGTGNVTSARIIDSNGIPVITDMSVDIPGSGADIIIVNGLNSTAVSSGNAVIFVAGQIVGS